MSVKEANLEVLVKYGDIEATFRGKPDDVIRSLLSFIGKILPAYELLSGLTLTVDLERLLDSVKGLIAFAPEGPVVTVPREKISGERDIITLHLIKAYVGRAAGRLERDSLTSGEMMTLTGGKSGTVGARLSELTSLGWVERIGRGEYRITTLGVKAFLDEILPRIKPREEP